MNRYRDNGSIRWIASALLSVVLAGWASNNKFGTLGGLRAAGTVVIRMLPGQSGDPRQMGCSRKLEKRAHGWEITPL